MKNFQHIGIDKLVFDFQDTEMFNIEDIKLKIAVVQNYFFPRLEVVLRHSIDLIRSIYNLEPLDLMTRTYRPNNRPSAKENANFQEVTIGLSGKRTSTNLAFKNPSGGFLKFHPTYLVYHISTNEIISVKMNPFIYKVDEESVQRFKTLVQENLDLLLPIWEFHHISHGNLLLFSSPDYYFPVNARRGLSQLSLTFAALYPLLHSLVLIGESEQPKLEEMLNQLHMWYEHKYSEYENNYGNEHTPDDVHRISEVDTYKFVPPSIRYDVFKRDKWRCLSCGRGPKDGVQLEADHIIPGSKGGKLVMSNLQTLCRECNIGKSNRDSTDLR